ncbi:MAG: 16S rRNA (cytidine(1402)-2'-O)-methyltransferase [Desulfobacterales bacterium]|nr:16S rRNA (cytidine(1402)-2'-O)-methyltransferase [Desulfobacterales bacterium]
MSRPLHQTGTLYVVATPIGNLEDITLRAIRILGEVDLIAAEDTRHTRKLLTHFGLNTPLKSYYKDKEKSRSAKIIQALLQGRNVALVSDAGTPGISDPGSILVRAARAVSVPVVPVPGPSALTTAISVAGFLNSAFVFLGFLPSRAAEQQRLLTSLVHEQRDLVFYESPRRLEKTLAACLEILGNRQIFWARELTKLHEELRPVRLVELLEELGEREIKGESVILIRGAVPQETPPEDLAAALAWYKEKGTSLKEAVQRLSQDLGLARSRVYQEALAVWDKH